MAENARWRLGPFLIYPSIRIRNIGYDNNIYQMREAEYPVGDFTAAVSPQATFYIPYRNWLILSFSVNPEYVYYTNEKNLRGFNFNHSPGFRLLFLNRFVTSGSYQFQRVRQRATVEFDRQIYVENRTLNASLYYETTRMTSFGFSGSARNIKYDDSSLTDEDISVSRALDREELRGNFEFYYRIFLESFFFMNIGYTEYNFEDFESQWRNSYSYQVSSGIRFPILGRARGTLSLGYRWLINRSDENLRFSGLFGDTGLDFRLGRFNFRLQFVRDFRFSYSSTNLYFIENRIGTGLSFYLTQFMRLDYDFSYGEGKYPDEVIVPLPDGGFEEVERADTYLSHTAGLIFRVIRNTGIGLTITYWERDSSIEGLGRTRTFIGGYLTYDF